jgi:hypothetical protein
MRWTYRVLVILAIGLGAVAVLCIAAPALVPTTYSQSDLMRPEILVAGVAELVRVPATSLALIAAIGAVFVRAITWKPSASRAGRVGRLNRRREL